MGEVYFKRFNTSQVVLGFLPSVRPCFCWIWNLREAFGFADVLAAGVGHACVLGLFGITPEIAEDDGRACQAFFWECCEFAT